MSSSMPTDTTPLLGNASSSVSNNNNNKNKHKKDGVRQHLLEMTPLQSFIALLCLAAVVFSTVYMLLKYNLPRDLTDEQRKWLKFPRNAEDVQHLSIVLEAYLAQHYTAVMTCFVATYVSMQAFAIPGSLMLSVLGGALFKFRVGLTLVLFCASFGSLCCYFISYYLGHPIVEKYLKARIATLQVKVIISQRREAVCLIKGIDAKRDQLFFYFAFLRVTPFIPNWFMNISSPHLDIPPHIFFFGTLVGVLPNSLVTVQAGVTLAALASPEDFTLLTPQNIIMTVVICICLLLPIVLHRHVEDPTATPKANSDEEDPLTRV
ncbi:Transmembrane protein 41B [Mortierella sp. AD094]|nr:Transmembrane protein 41B [Mortierella sp. AD094]